MTINNLEAAAELLWKNRRQEASVWEPMAEAIMSKTDLREPQDKGFFALASSLAHQAKGDFERAHEQAQMALSYFSDSALSLWQARCLMVEGFLHINQNAFISALDDWKRAYSIGQAVGDREIIISTLYSIAILNRVNLQRYADSIEYFERVLTLCMETDPPYALTGNVYSGLSKCHMAMGHQDTAENYAMLALDYGERFGDKRTLGWSLELCVSTYITLGDLEKASQYAARNLEVWKLLDDSYGLSIAYQDLATLHRLKGELTDAFSFGQKALTYAQHMNSQLVLETLYSELASLAEALNDYPASLAYYKAYMLIREASLKASFDREISQVAGELKLENYRLKHVELEEKMRALKEAQEALVRSEKMNALLGLVGGVAHEINTPLGNSMTLNSYMLSECEKMLSKSADNRLDVAELIDYLDTDFEAQKGIEKGLNTVARIVESFKRIAVNPNGINIQPVHTAEFLIDWKNGLKFYYPEYSAAIDINCPSDHVSHIDLKETMKILDELYLNVVKHAYAQADGHFYEGKHKRILVEVLPQAASPIDSKAPNKGSLTLHFTDYGCGIEPDWIERIFEPFVRKGVTPSNLGIGLHVVYNIVVYVLLGSITLTSTQGEGTTVTLTV